MKCPKCSYLGFETGDRCRNCGYDFSLMTAPAAVDPELTLRASSEDQSEVPALPLFAQGRIADDEPLIKVAPAPRPPLAVRRTPEMPKLRGYAKPARRPDPEPALEFADEPAEPVRDPAPAVRPAARRPPARPPVVPPHAPMIAARRVGAAAIDLSMLIAIDAAIVYFTLRMASLTMHDWRLLPAAPMLAFLTMVKLAYFCAFTSLGGQTIGKMAMRIRVVADDHRSVDPGRAVQRVAVGALSALTLGLAFIPALIGPDRRAPHDRFARTRVVARSS